MQANTDLGLTLAAGALLALLGRRPPLARALGGAVLLLAVLTLLEYRLAVDLGIDRLLGDPHLTVKARAPRDAWPPVPPSAWCRSGTACWRLGAARAMRWPVCWGR
jgi:hypothetical protein